MAELYVIRHGRVPSNDSGIIVGRDDEELTEVGLKQARIVRDKLKNINFSAIYSSDVKRAIQTANIVNSNNLKIITDNRLAEREPGGAYGKKRKEIDKEEWNSLILDKTSDGAETLKAGLIRTESILTEIHKLYEKERVLIVTHNFICKCIWMLENNITDKEEINAFFQNNDEIRRYIKKK